MKAYRVQGFTCTNCAAIFENNVKETEEQALKLGGRPENILTVLRLFYDNPILNSSIIVSKTRISKGTVDNIIKRLYDNKILYELTGYSRNRVFALADYLKIFI